MKPYLEHLNLTVVDVDRTIRFLQTAMPELEVRGGGTGEKCKRWAHVGTDATYISLEDRGAEGPGPHQPYVHPGLNHIGFVVNDVEEVRGRLRAAGYKSAKDEMGHPQRRRIYFYDDDNNEFEFIEYLSAEPAERNDYQL
jgi:catechol 2,3-dioxygenase-like lactoylglutathione lyase family enzyme